MQSIKEITRLPVFFIIGRPRSGTSLLRHLFDAHPDVVIPSECNYILALSRKYGNIEKSGKQTITNLLTDLKQTKSFNTWGLDIESLEKKLYSLKEKSNYSELCRVIHSSYSSIHPKNELKIIGDKNPAYSSENFSKIFSLFPDAKYIHLVRDCRDQITSLLSAGFKLPSPAFIAIAWKKSITTINKYKQKFPDHFYTIRYEDFVTEPEEYFKEICCFLGIKFQQDVFDFIDKKNEYLNHQPGLKYEQLHQRLFQPINNKRVGIYRDFLNSKDLAIVEKIVGHVAEQYGYKKNRISSNFFVFLTLIKWSFIYKIFALLRSFSFTLPIQKRNFLVGKIKRNSTLSSFYNKLTKSKTGRK